MENQKWAKLVDGELIWTDTTKIDDNFMRIQKSDEELFGYRPVVFSNKPYINIYQNLIETYNEDANNINVIYSAVDKTEEEITQINTSFWNDSYFQVMSLMPEVLYAPYVSYLNGKPHDLLQDDYAVLLMGASANQLTHLELYSAPDFTQQFTSEYISTLKVIITDEAKMTATLGYFGTLNYESRTVPSVI